MSADDGLIRSLSNDPLPVFKKHKKAPVVTASTSTAPPIVFPRWCSTASCNNVIPESSPFRSCLKCRTKDKEKRTRKKERRLADLMRAIGLEGEMGVEKEMDDEPPLKKQKVHKSGAAKGQKKNKRPSGLALGHGPNVPIGEKVAAYVRARRLKEGSASTFGKRQILQMEPAADGTRPACIEFRTSTELHDALADAVKRYYKSCLSRSVASPVAFQGCYSIVMDPSVSHERRVALESTLLKKISKVPHSVTGRISDTLVTASSWTCTFRCNCSQGRPQPPPAPAPAAPVISAHMSTPSSLDSSSSTPPSTTITHKKSLKRQQSDLSKWILRRQGIQPIRRPVPSPLLIDARGPPGSGLLKFASAPTTALPPSAPVIVPPCGGRIHITARDDLSHSLGGLCKGQRIFVVVEHPVSRR